MDDFVQMVRYHVPIAIVSLVMLHVTMTQPYDHAIIADASPTDDPYCICADKSLCRPLTTPLPTKEVFVFQTNALNWKHYDWSLVTTIALFDQDHKLLPELLCYAHARNVRLVFGNNGPPAAQLTNATLRAQLVQAEIDKALSM